MPPHLGYADTVTTLTKLDENLWETSAPLKVPGLRMNHRMAVVRLSSGELLIHSPIQFSRELAESILALGQPAWFVAPSRFHDMYWPEWFRAFPKSHFVAVPGLKEDHPKLPFTHTLGEETNLWDSEINPLPLRGMPRINEFALFHSASRTLLTADLIFNIDPAVQNAFGRLFLKLNSVYKKPGISRLFRACIKDKQVFSESLQQIQSHQFDRIIIGHGANLKGTDALERAIIEAGFPPTSRTNRFKNRSDARR